MKTVMGINSFVTVTVIKDYKRLESDKEKI